MSLNTIPPLSPRGPYISWCEAHAATFDGNAVAIGLTSAKTTAYSALVKDAQAAVAAMEAQKIAYRNSVVEAATAMRNLNNGVNGTGELVRTIRAFADSTATPSAVLALAEIDPIAPPTPIPAPNAPTEVSVGIDLSNGGIILKWKASQQTSGTVYIIKRRVDSSGPWQYIGSAGSDKTFTDTTFTPGPDSVQYSIQAQRSNKFSSATMVAVTFGTGGNGQVAVTGVKLAA